MSIIQIQPEIIATQKLVSGLNPEQNQAVTAPTGHTLVLAGAGSGKTKVLVHRIAYLINVKKASSKSILAVTFTNKAANEMKKRIEQMLENPLGNMWVGTFHGLAHRMLRLHWQEADLSQTFQIMDSGDQLRVVRRIHKELNLDEDKWPSKESQWYINKNKDAGLRPQNLASDGNSNTAMLLRVYHLYEENCKRNGLIDFAELLLRSQELLKKNPSILEHYQNMFKHILVDEFQDTNSTQYDWICMLASSGADIMVVGDDDQSIYSWRGAKIENIIKFNKNFPNVITIRLEQNYRSTNSILKAANAVISHNNYRLGKNLWTSQQDGVPIKLYNAYNEVDEAKYVISCIKDWVDAGNKMSEAAILYRSNAQSRIFEEFLIQEDLPYKIYGGLRFYERAEIKDALAYLRLIANRHDDYAFERIVNVPTRGIGNTTLQEVRDFSKENSVSLWEGAQIMSLTDKLSKRASSALIKFLKLVDDLANYNIDEQLHIQIDNVLKMSGLRTYFEQEKHDNKEMKLENLDELISSAARFSSAFANEAPNDTNMPILHSFLSYTSLEAGDNQSKNPEDSVQLMTLHSAKGLEFPLVFLSGMEEFLFPHQMSMTDPRSLEEERRLCYVGMTRAMKKLHLTYASIRRINGSNTYRVPSRFIKEIPRDCIVETI